MSTPHPTEESTPDKGPTVLSSGIRRYSGEHQHHIHGHAQIMFGLAGRMELEVEGHLAYVDSSCGLVIPADAVHGFWAPTWARMFVLDVPADLNLEKTRRFAVTPACLRSVANGLPTAQLAQVLAAPTALARRGLDLAQLDDALHNHLHEPWPTARMAALFCLSPPHFHARLRELTGLTPQAYVRECRLSNAVHALQQGAALDYTALRVGYASASALSTALKREHGFSTRQWRSGEQPNPAPSLRESRHPLSAS